MSRGRFRSSRVAAAIAVLLVLSAGCSKEEQPAAPVVKKAVPKEAAKAAEAARPSPAEAKPPPVAFYSPAGKRDPFLPFLKVEKKESLTDVSSLPPLQRYELGELRFVGIIWGPDMTRALVEDSEGKGYTVTVGTKIGRSEGVVTRITEGELFVRESFRDYSGAKVMKENSLKLQTAGGK